MFYINLNHKKMNNNSMKGHTFVYDFPDDLWFNILSRCHWTVLLKCEFLSEFFEKLSKSIIETQLQSYIENKLPKMCFGNSSIKNKNKNIVKTCSHQRKKHFCFAYPFIPHFNERVFKKKKLIYCPITNSIQRPTKRRQRISNTDIFGHRELKIIDVYHNTNPKWLCSVKPLKKRKSQTYTDFYAMSIYPNIICQISKFKSTRYQKSLVSTIFHPFLCDLISISVQEENERKEKEKKRMYKNIN